MSEKQGWLKRLGLHWILIIFDDSKFEKHPRPEKERFEEITTQLDALDENIVDDVLCRFDQMYRDDDQRRVEIDAKASAIIGFIGIVGGIIAAFTPLLLNNDSSDKLILLIIAVLYLMIGLALVFTVVLANRALEVGKEAYMSPNPSDLLGLREWNKEFLSKRLAGDILKSYEHNRALINDKASYVRAAQDWFRNTVFCLFLLVLVVAVASVFTGGNVSEPVTVIILTPTPHLASSPPSVTMTPSPTVTSPITVTLPVQPYQSPIVTPSMTNTLAATSVP
jgi:hypothetical protein